MKSFKEILQEAKNSNPKGEHRLTKELWKEYLNYFKGATISQTMGPNYKTIFWSPINRPYYVEDKKIKKEIIGKIK